MTDTRITVTRMTTTDGGTAVVVRFGIVAVEMDEEDAAKLLHQLATVVDGKDAATDALDKIAEIAGCQEWEYPGQVVRDVAALKKKYNDSYEAHTNFVESLRSLTGCPGTLSLSQHVSDLMGPLNCKRWTEQERKPDPTGEAHDSGDGSLKP